MWPMRPASRPVCTRSLSAPPCRKPYGTEVVFKTITSDCFEILVLSVIHKISDIIECTAHMSSITHTKSAHLHEPKVAGAALVVRDAADGDVGAAGAVVVNKLHVVHAVPVCAQQQQQRRSVVVGVVSLAARVMHSSSCTLR